MCLLMPLSAVNSVQPTIIQNDHLITVTTGKKSLGELSTASHMIRIGSTFQVGTGCCINCAEQEPTAYN